MPVERPTFSESWYRVADLRVRLRSTVNIRRQHYRGQLWYVLYDAATNDFFRLNLSAYRFVAMLDSRRTIADVWNACLEQFGDDAPTQGEVVTLLGQLYTSNLLMGELPPDAEGLLQRYHRRRTRQAQGYLQSLLFLRIPLFDPDGLLNRWGVLFNWMFSPVGFALWAVLILTGLYHLGGHIQELWDRSQGILSPQNLPLLYVAIVLTKISHEFGHSFAVKHFGQVEGQRGEVHVMGVMFLIFMPLPYMDASSAWGFRNKWRRVAVGAGGIYLELAIAAIATIIWAYTAKDSPTNALAYNVIFIAGVSSLLFNANPLLRYDGYYILADLLEIPNLQLRSQSYLKYLVKRYAWGVERLKNPAHTTGERIWFVIFGILSTCYRIFIFGMILLFMSNRLPKPLTVLAIGFAIIGGAMWISVPLAKFVRYLASSPELSRVRSRAVLTTLATVVLVVGGVGLWPVSDYVRVEGVVEPQEMAVVYTEEGGFLQSMMPTNQIVTVNGRPVATLTDRELVAKLYKLRYQLQQAQLQLQSARAPETRDVARAQVLEKLIARLHKDIRYMEGRVARLNVEPPQAGFWIAPELEARKGMYVQPGEPIGMVADLDHLQIRAVVGQSDKTLLSTADKDVQIRLQGRPADFLAGKLDRVDPAGQKRLPSAALGYVAGGMVATDPRDPNGVRTTESIFQVLVTPDANTPVRLLPGQRVVIRFRLTNKPLAVQWWRSLRRLFQRRFGL